MKLNTVIMVTSYNGSYTGHAEFTGDGINVKANFNAEEIAQLEAIGWKAFQRRQEEVADEIRLAAPLQLAAPIAEEAEYADFTEAVEAKPLGYDEIPF